MLSTSSTFVWEGGEGGTGKSRDVMGRDQVGGEGKGENAK